jgi:putative transposase
MRKLGTGYTNYFNKKYDRSGSLFQGKFKAIHIDANEYLLWLSGYVNGNAEIHKISKAEDYKWGSYQDYLGLRNGTLCNKEIILSQFKNAEEYKKHTEMVIRESGKRKDMEKYFIE